MNGQPLPWWEMTGPPLPPPPPPPPPMANNNGGHANMYGEQHLHDTYGTPAGAGYPIAFQQQQSQYLGNIPPPPPPQQMNFYGSHPQQQQQQQQNFNAAQNLPHPLPHPPVYQTEVQYHAPPPPPPPPLQQHYNHHHQQQPHSNSSVTQEPPPPPPPKSPSMVPQQVVRKPTKKRKRNKQVEPVPPHVRAKIQVGQVYQGELIRHRAQVPTQHHYGTRGMKSIVAEQRHEIKAAPVQEEEPPVTEEAPPPPPVLDEHQHSPPPDHHPRAKVDASSASTAKKKKKRGGKRSRKRKIHAETAAPTAVPVDSVQEERAAQSDNVDPASTNVVAPKSTELDAGVAHPAATTTTTTTTSNNKNAKHSRQALEEVKARLLQAKLKKLQMEERLRSAEPAMQSGEVSREDASSSTSTSTSTGNSANAETRSNVSATSRSSKAKEALDKLKAARSKLKGALKNRERAMRTSASRDNGSRLEPLSALSSSLIIRNISSTGPKDKVYFQDSSSRKAVERFLGKEMIEALHANVPPNFEEVYLSNDELESPAERSIDDPVSLASRKRQLQQELMALKEKLEKSQQKADANDAPPPKGAPVNLTKEELEKRKTEAQNMMDISYWKHFVSKQEHLLEQVTEKIAENEKALQECQKESHETNKNLFETQNEVDALEIRKQIVEHGIASSMTALLQARQALYDARQSQAAAGKGG